MIKHPYSTAPASIENGDTFCFIVIGKAGHADDWAAYRLALVAPPDEPFSLTVEEAIKACNEHGDKISEEIAKVMFFALGHSDRHYRD